MILLVIEAPVITDPLSSRTLHESQRLHVLEKVFCVMIELSLNLIDPPAMSVKVFHLTSSAAPDEVIPGVTLVPPLEKVLLLRKIYQDVPAETK